MYWIWLLILDKMLCFHFETWIVRIFMIPVVRLNHKKIFALGLSQDLLGKSDYGVPDGTLQWCIKFMSAKQKHSFTWYVSGTRIIYDRAFLMQCRNSPLAKSPPPNLPKIPGVTTPETGSIQENGHQPMEQQLTPDQRQQPRQQERKTSGLITIALYIAITCISVVPLSTVVSLHQFKHLLLIC